MRLLILITTLLPLSLLAGPSSWTPLFNGKDLTVSLNGITVTELLTDTKCQKQGHITLQLHGSLDMHVEFKDIDIFEL